MLREFGWVGVALFVGCASPAADDSTSAGADITGGKADQRWSASGYLATSDLSKAECGATLIAPNVAVTTASCVVDDSKALVFGTGNVGSGQTVKVTARHLHPEFHAVAKGMFDLQHILRNHDLAYVVLEHAVAGVVPAALPTEEISDKTQITAIGYNAKIRRSTPAHVSFSVDATLGMGDSEDPVLEVAPDADGSLCVTEGDGGSPIVSQDGVLLGVFVGSALGCHPALEFMDGFESTFGFRDFLVPAILLGAPQ